MNRDELYSRFAIWSLSVLVLSFLVHLVALVVFVPDALAIVILLVIPGQFVLIWGANGGRLFPEKPTHKRRGQSWKYFFVGLKFIPPWWRYGGLGFWYVYCPIVAIACSVEENGSAFVALGTAAFALIHYLGFRFLLPKRETIIAAVNRDPNQSMNQAK